METKKKLLFLFDRNRGHQLQLIALAEALADIMPIDYELVSLNYGWLAKWPLLFGKPWFSGLKNFSSKLDRVDAIFSAGHATARPAIFLKERLHAHHAIHLLSPNGGGNFFDLLIRSFHECKTKLPKNMMTITGGLSKWNQHRLQEMKSQALALAKKKIPDFDSKKEKIAILLGGNSRLHVFNKKAADRLLDNLKELAANNFLFITPSSRTPSFVQLKLQKEISFHGNVWLDDGRDNNVYGMMVALADKFIVTNDSINMISETLLTKKPVSLFRLPYKNLFALSWQCKKILRYKRFIRHIQKNFDVQYYKEDSKRPLQGSKSVAPDNKTVNSAEVAEAVKKILTA